MQAVPRIFSTDADGKDQREFMADFFDNIGQMATNIFLKGYQWPFDPQRIENKQSSLIDILVFNETQKGRRVFMDFLHNPIGNGSAKPFRLEELGDEALQYLQSTGALQSLPIERLAHMNRPAIEIYRQHNIDLYSEPLEIAVCAQHNNGGFAVDKWWQSNIAGVFVIGEMAGTHGVKRPGGSALNAGQTGGLRAAEYIANVYDLQIAAVTQDSDLDERIGGLVNRLDVIKKSANQLTPRQAIRQIQHRMTLAAGHIRQLNQVNTSLKEAVELYTNIIKQGLKTQNAKDLILALQARHLALTSIAYLKAVSELLKAGGGSRGSFLVLTDDGIEIHPDIIDQATKRPLRFKPEALSLRSSIIQIQYDRRRDDLFRCETIAVRPAPDGRKAFEPAWRDYRDGKIFTT